MPWLVPALVLVGMVGASIACSVAGDLLRMQLCFGSGSECRNGQPLWETGGRALVVAANVLFFSAPVVVALVAGRLHIRRRDRAV